MYQILYRILGFQKLTIGSTVVRVVQVSETHTYIYIYIYIYIYTYIYTRGYISKSKMLKVSTTIIIPFG
jgi:hypothetical protein